MADTGFTIPSLIDVVTRVRSDVDSAIPGADSALRRTALGALSLALGGSSWLLHRFGGEIAKETLPDCASETGVTRWRKMWGLPDVTPIRSAGDVDVTGVTGAQVTTDDSLVRADGVTYSVTTGATLVGGAGTVTVQADVAGSDGDMIAGQPLTFAEPVAGVDSEATVAAGGIVGGVDVESVEAERTRVLERMADPPQGGNDADFRQWTREAVNDVRTVYVGRNEPNFGFVTLRFILEPLDANGDFTGDPVDALPTAAQVQAVRDYIAGTEPEDFLDSVAPVPIARPLTGTYAQVDGRIDVREITGQAVDFEITDLDPDTPAIRDEVEAALRSLFLQRGAPGGTLKLSQIIGAIDSAPSEDSHELTGVDGGAPADVVIGADSFPILGTVTYL